MYNFLQDNKSWSISSPFPLQNNEECAKQLHMYIVTPYLRHISYNHIAPTPTLFTI
jgi:hypothetical protein